MNENSTTITSHARELAQGDRFAFGANWSRFLTLLDERRIEQAEESLCRMLEVEHLNGRTFLDIGSGSGLFSLAARRLGARVCSFDYDTQSVACTKELRRRFFPDDADWRIETGSVLDETFIEGLGLFDVVYSWGVLHHTGDMHRALAHAALPVSVGGKLFIAIYNDTGTQSSRWHWIKRKYNQLHPSLRIPFAILVSVPQEAKSALRALLKLRPQDYVRTWTKYDPNRGMSHWRDIIDWVGGYPYEVATPELIFDFYRNLGFSLTRLKCGGVGLGCNEFVFVREGRS